MIKRKFLKREKKGRFKRWLKGIPSAIKGWLYEHRKGLIATFATFFALITVITCLTFIPYYARMPKAVEGNLFDREVLSFLMVEGLERPDGAIEESFEQGKIHKTNKRGEPIKAYNALYYEYSCYTLEPLGDSYVLEVKNLFDQRQGDEFVYGKFYPREHIFSNSFVSGSNDCLIYRENEEGEGDKGAKYESVTFSAKYTTVIKRILYIDIFVPAVDYFMMYPRTVTVTSMLEPNENGKYKTVISFRCDLETMIIYKYEENKSVAKKFRKII